MTAALPDYQYIDTNEALAGFCDALRSKSYIAIDTEFLRERTYRPQLCLVQIKSEEQLACIDTLAFEDLSPLTDLLFDTSITKVLHAASQDLEIFYLMCKRVPTPLFDTQVAAPLLGYNEQIGYGNLVKDHLGIELSKSQTRADWTRRPLPDKQIAYALDDVIYLEQLYVDMQQQLATLGRLDWLAPEFAELEDIKKYDQPARERWHRIRNIQRYKGETLAIIQALAEWREIKAREINQPRNWLLKDDVLCTLAQQQPASAKDLSHIRGLDRKARERYGETLLSLISEARTRTPEAHPPFTKKQKLNETNMARVQLLNAWVHQRAAQLNINPGILAPPKVLEKMVTGDARAALHGWREPLIGDDLTGILEGRLSLRSSSEGLILAAT